MAAGRPENDRVEGRLHTRKKKKVQDAHTHKKTKTRQAAARQGVYNTRVFLCVTDNGKFMIWNQDNHHQNNTTYKQWHQICQSIY